MNKSALTRSGLAALCFAAFWLSCGGSSVSGEVGAAGGEVCLPDDRVCLKVPLGGLDTQQVVIISPGTDKPAGALSESYDISAANKKPITFLKAATVTFTMDLVDQSIIDDLPSDSLLRIYTREGDQWVPLSDPVVDRVARKVSGNTLHLSPFVILRSDRLPDGSIPVETDAGTRDSGSDIVVPPFDGGRPDAGPPDEDAGTPDSGTPDAGTPDAGTPDAGTADAGTPDAGTPDAGTPDAGAPDAGTPDAGSPDAGQDVDAGADAGEEYDAGDPDAGDDDAGTDAG